MSNSASATAAPSPSQAAFDIPHLSTPRPTTAAASATVTAATTALFTVAEQAMPKLVATAAPTSNPFLQTTLLNTAARVVQPPSGAAAAASHSIATGVLKPVASNTTATKNTAPFHYRTYKKRAYPTPTASAAPSTAAAAPAAAIVASNSEEDSAEEMRFGKKIKRAAGDCLSSIQALLSVSPEAGTMTSLAAIADSMQKAETPHSLLLILSTLTNDFPEAKMSQRARAMVAAAHNAVPAFVNAYSIIVLEIAATTKEAVATSTAAMISAVTITQPPNEAKTDAGAKLHAEAAFIRDQLRGCPTNPSGDSKKHLEALTELSKIWACFSEYVHQVSAYVRGSAALSAATKTDATASGAAHVSAGAMTISIAKLSDIASTVRVAAHNVTMNAQAISTALAAFPLAGYGPSVSAAHATAAAVTIHLLKASQNDESEKYSAKK